jgi:hypothetical protein
VDRDKLYDYLQKEAKPIETRLDLEGQVELDGILWKIAVQLALDSSCVQFSKGV